LEGRGVEIVECREATDLLGDHVDGTLSLLQRWRLRLHWWTCRDCRNYLFSYLTTVRAVKAAHRATPENPPVGLLEALVNLIVSAAKRERDNDGSRHKQQ
jgi:Putative zinc-finger